MESKLTKGQMLRVALKLIKERTKKVVVLKEPKATDDGHVAELRLKIDGLAIMDVVDIAQAIGRFVMVSDYDREERMVEVLIW